MSDRPNFPFTIDGMAAAADWEARRRAEAGEEVPDRVPVFEDWLPFASPGDRLQR